MVEVDYTEARRYLGLHRPGGVVDRALEDQLHACGAELERTARPKALWREFPLTLGEGTVELAGLHLESRHLARHLAGCERACLFAATLGAETDRLLRRASVADMGRAVLFQACAASLLEVYCDQCCGRIQAETGLFLRPRFSPGYGDWSAECQGALLSAVEARRIGLAVTQGMMLTPTKSVTAVVGLSETPWCGVKGCAGCGKLDCGFRR